MKTSLTLSREVIRGIDRVAWKKRSRSAVVDDVLRGYLSHREHARLERPRRVENQPLYRRTERRGKCARLPVARPPLGGAWKYKGGIKKQENAIPPKQSQDT